MRSTCNKYLKLTTTLIALGWAMSGSGKEYTIDKKGSKVSFSLKGHTATHKESVRGMFPDVEGKIVFDPAKPESSWFDVKVSTKTVVTGNKELDALLKGFGYFNSGQYQMIGFSSDAIKHDPSAGPKFYTVRGDLKIKGISKKTQGSFTANPTPNGYIFRGTILVSRKLYEVGDPGEADDLVPVFIELKTK